jgi:hypothetical protein
MIPGPTWVYTTLNEEALHTFRLEILAILFNINLLSSFYKLFIHCLRFFPLVFLWSHSHHSLEIEANYLSL